MGNEQQQHQKVLAGASASSGSRRSSSGKTLKPHADDMDEFIFQVRGYKRWTFKDNTTLVLAPGDGLFVPRNTWHSVSLLASGEESAHLAVGVKSVQNSWRSKVNLRGDLQSGTGDFYFSVPPTEKSMIEFMQEEHWAVISLFIAYAVQALLFIIFVMCCINWCVHIDPDQGGRGSTVR